MNLERFKLILNTVPEHYNFNVYLCVAHFTENSFQKLWEYNTGYTQNNLLFVDHNL